MKKHCFFWQHKYEKWRLIKSLFSEKGGRVKLIQTRTCKNCNYTQIRTEEV